MKQVALRIPPELYKALKKLAEEQHRSMTAQAGLLLEYALANLPKQDDKTKESGWGW